MSNPQRGVLLVVSGPSGAGKGTVVDRLMAQNDNFRLSISATTRPPRTNEEPGKSYHFVSTQEFEDLITHDQLLEYNEYNGNLYGTPVASVFELLDNGFDVILEIDMNGAEQIRDKVSEVVSIFVVPKQFDDLEKRLISRYTENMDDIKRRLMIARKEYTRARDYDYVVLNDTIEDAVSEIMAIVTAEKCKTRHRARLIESGENALL